MVKIREIADNNSSISSTRWAFAAVVKFDIVAIAVSVISIIVGHFIGKPFDDTTVKGIALLIGVLTTITGGSKIMQGFEPKEK
jgi:hypothetical protein